MAVRKLPPKVIERRSDERQVFELLNALRDAYMDLVSGGSSGRSLFSTALGRGDSTTTTSGNEDAFILQWELPFVFSSFNFNMGGMLSSALGTATVRARLGGTWNTFDGTVIATITGASPTLVDVSTIGNLVTLNTATLLKLTLQASGAGHKATFVGGFVIGN